MQPIYITILSLIINRKKPPMLLRNFLKTLIPFPTCQLHLNNQLLFKPMAASSNMQPKQSRKPPKQQFMKITQKAKQRIMQLMQKKQDPEIIGVKIGLTKRGCNGLTYSMNYVKKDALKKFDEVVTLDNGLKIIVDNKAIMAILGTELDFVETQIGSQFVFNNPNEKGRCGCGESFHI